MRHVIFLLVLICLGGAMWWMFKVDTQALAAHDRQQHEQATNQVLEAQHQCKELAQARLRVQHMPDGTTASAKGRYNAASSQCFALIESTTQAQDTQWKRITLFDQAGKVYASYEWHNQPGQNPAGVPPYTCQLTPPGAAFHPCRSEDEFRKLVAPYMQ